MVVTGNGTAFGEKSETNVPQLSRHTCHGWPGTAAIIAPITQAGFFRTGYGPFAIGDIAAEFS